MVVFYILAVIIVALSPIVLWLIPIAVGLVMFCVFRLCGMGVRSSALMGIFIILIVITWPLIGLYELSCQCDQFPPIEKKISQKIGPIDILLVDGPAMNWLLGKIDIEEPRWHGSSRYRRIEVETYPILREELQELKESELRSRYQVSIEWPQEGKFVYRYLTKASISITDRETGVVVLKTYEPAWGGGIVGPYIAMLNNMTFLSSSETNYLSCGYAGRKIMKYRSRFDLYEKADRKLLEEIFILQYKQK